VPYAKTKFLTLHHLGKPCLTVHMTAKDTRNAMKEASEICKRLKIKHATIQVQDERDSDCFVCGDHGGCI